MPNNRYGTTSAYNQGARVGVNEPIPPEKGEKAVANSRKKIEKTN